MLYNYLYKHVINTVTSLCAVSVQPKQKPTVSCVPDTLKPRSVILTVRAYPVLTVVITCWTDEPEGMVITFSRSRDCPGSAENVSCAVKIFKLLRFSELISVIYGFMLIVGTHNIKNEV